MTACLSDNSADLRASYTPEPLHGARCPRMVKHGCSAVYSRRLLLNASRLILEALLFTQFAHVAQACLRPDAGPAAAYSAASSQLGKASANLCLDHCLQSARILDNLPAPPSDGVARVVAGVVAPEYQQVTGIVLCEPELLSRETLPPIFLRHCVLRN